MQSLNFEPSSPANRDETSDFSHFSGACLNTLRGHRHQVWTIAYSLDGQLLASGSDDQTIRLWDMQDGTCQNLLQEHTSRVCSVQFSPIDVSLPSNTGLILARACLNP